MAAAISTLRLRKVLRLLRFARNDILTIIIKSIKIIRRSGHQDIRAARAKAGLSNLPDIPAS